MKTYLHSKGRREMTITHVLSDGRVLDSIAGHVVKADQVAAVYDLISSINQRQERGKDEKTESNPN